MNHIMKEDAEATPLTRMTLELPYDLKMELKAASHAEECSQIAYIRRAIRNELDRAKGPNTA